MDGLVFRRKVYALLDQISAEPDGVRRLMRLSINMGKFPRVGRKATQLALTPYDLEISRLIEGLSRRLPPKTASVHREVPGR